MVRALVLLAAASHCGDETTSEPQKSDVVPQKPKALQHTLSGHVDALDHCAPQPGSHSLL